MYPLYWKKDNFANFLAVNKAPVSYVEDLSVFTKQYAENKVLKEYAQGILEYIGKNTSELNRERGDRRLTHFFTKGFQFSLPQPEVYAWLVEEYGIDKMEGYKTIEEMKRELKSNGAVYNIPEGRYNSNHLEYGKHNTKSNHPTEKPVELLKHLVEVYTNEGDTVLDNTMGSGSTGVACVETGREFIGIELDEKYYRVAKDRISRANKR